MGSVRLTFCCGAVVAAALTPTASPPAHAAGGGFSVTPSRPVPGSDVQLRAQGCSGRTGTASSRAFVAEAVLTGKGGALVGETRVRSSIGPGTYRVGVSCDGVEDKVRAVLTVDSKAGGREPSAATTTPTTPTTPPAPAAPVAPVSPFVSPFAPVRAGGGGTARTMAGEGEEPNARDEGPGTRQALVGLVLAGVAGLVVVLRGLRGGRGTE
ncbi:hypothetical protein [Streptomyces sp. NPDC046862]|uniref:hypothetical protein n=1 Tax=Streptomyces sp. NPDC046862 TaxID=3154603 RepID=UPI003452E2AF